MRRFEDLLTEEETYDFYAVGPLGGMRWIGSTIEDPVAEVKRMLHDVEVKKYKPIWLRPSTVGVAVLSASGAELHFESARHLHAS